MVTARLLVDLVLFRDKVRAPSGMPWLFLTKAGAFIQPSVSKIIALIQSKTYGIMSNPGQRDAHGDRVPLPLGLD
jgi:hypothetical protein